MTGHVARSAVHRPRLRRSAILASIVLGSMLVAPGPLSAVDPTPAPPDGPEMFRLPDDPGTPPRAPTEVAAVEPAGFHDTVVFSGLTQPDGGGICSGRPGTRRREAWNDQVLRLALGSQPHDLRRPAGERPRLLGSRAARPRPGRELHDTMAACTRSTRTTTSSATRPAPSGSTQPARTSARTRQVRPRTAASRVLGCHGWKRTRAASGTATSTSSSRAGARFIRATRSGPSPSGRTAPSTRVPGRAPASSTRTTARTSSPCDDVTPDNPCGDPPSPVGTALSPPIGPGRRASLAGHADNRRPGRVVGDHHPRQPDDRRRDARQRVRRRRRRRICDESSRTASATPSASPSGRARVSSGSATSGR